MGKMLPQRVDSYMLSENAIAGRLPCKQAEVSDIAFITTPGMCDLCEAQFHEYSH
jgi:hypothetical protein